MMGGDFGSQAGALLLIPVLLVAIAIGAVFGGGLVLVGSWLLSVIA